MLIQVEVVTHIYACHSGLIFWDIKRKKVIIGGLGFYFNKEEKYEIWVLKFDKEEDDIVSIFI